MQNVIAKNNQQVPQSCQHIKFTIPKMLCWSKRHKPAIKNQNGSLIGFEALSGVSMQFNIIYIMRIVGSG